MWWVGGAKASRVATLALLSLETLSCDALKHVFDEPPPLPEKHPTHDLTIDQGIARFNGKPIAPGVPLSRWVELLGEPDRVTGQYHLWDRLGLGAASSDQPSDEARSKLMVDCLLVVYRPSRVFTRGAFAGRTLMEGAAVYEGVTVGSVNRQFQRKCEGSGAGFTESVPPGAYVCNTESPGREYELRVDIEDHAAKVRWLNFCEADAD